MMNATKVRHSEVVLDVMVTPQMIRELRQALGQSLTEFGLTLRREIEPRARSGYTKQYISRLEHGKDVITPELQAAFFDLAARLDDVPAGLGGAVSVAVLAQPGQIQAGAFIKRSLQDRRCKGCNVIFVGYGKFHDPDCRKEFYKRLRKNHG